MTNIRPQHRWRAWQDMTPEEEVQLLHSFAQQHRLYRTLIVQCQQEHNKQQARSRSCLWRRCCTSASAGCSSPMHAPTSPLHCQQRYQPPHLYLDCAGDRQLQL